MKNNSFCSHIQLHLAAVFALCIATSANAATWHIQSLTDNGVTTTGFYYFTDGMFTTEQTISYQGTNYSDRQWLTKASGSAPYNIAGYFFASYLGNAPSVNMATHTIDLSGLYWFGLNPVANTGAGYNEGWIYSDYIGWTLQPTNWECTSPTRSGCLSFGWVPYSNLPYTVNPDGTFTANWISNSWYGTSTLSMTFYSATTVPVPSTLWLLSSGLLGLLGLTRRIAD